MAEALPLFASLAEAIEAPYRGDWDAWPRDPESGEWLRSTVELRVEGDPKVARFQLPISGVDDHLLRVAWRDPSWSLRRTNPSKEEAGLDDPFGEQVSEGLGPESGLAPVLEQGPHAEVHGATVIAHVTAAGFTLNQADPGAPLAEAPGVVFTFAEGATWGGFHAALCELNGHGLELAAIISSVPSRAVFVD